VKVARYEVPGNDDLKDPSRRERCDRMSQDAYIAPDFFESGQISEKADSLG
jgi:hypothetical protein